MLLANEQKLIMILADCMFKFIYYVSPSLGSRLTTRSFGREYDYKCHVVVMCGMFRYCLCSFKNETLT